MNLCIHAARTCAVLQNTLALDKEQAEAQATAIIDACLGGEAAVDAKTISFKDFVTAMFEFNSPTSCESASSLKILARLSATLVRGVGFRNSDAFTRYLFLLLSMFARSWSQRESTKVRRTIQKSLILS